MEINTKRTCLKRKNLSDYQAGGHDDRFIYEEDRVLKVFRESEYRFYQSLNDEENDDFVEFRQIAPRFYGLQQHHGCQYLILENLIMGYEHPNIMDLKIGKKEFKSSYSPEKLREKQELYKNRITYTLGIKVSGIIMKNNLGEKTYRLGLSEEIDAITVDTVIDYFKKFVTENNIIQTDIVEEFIAHTERILNWFQRNNQMLFKRTSLLYITGKNKRCQVRQVDFALVEESQGRIDENNIESIQNIISIWKKVLIEALADRQ